MGEPLGWAWEKAACGEERKGGPSGAQAAVCLAWRLYASFGADIVHGALAFAPTLGGRVPDQYVYRPAGDTA